MSGYIDYWAEVDLTPIVDRIAEHVQHRVNQAALDRAADALSEYGYVKVVRCSDCGRASFDEFGGGWCNENQCEIEPWDFCSWPERRDE